MLQVSPSSCGDKGKVRGEVNMARMLAGRVSLQMVQELCRHWTGLRLAKYNLQYGRGHLGGKECLEEMLARRSCAGISLNVIGCPSPSVVAMPC